MAEKSPDRVRSYIQNETIRQVASANWGDQMFSTFWVERDASQDQCFIIGSTRYDVIIILCDNPLKGTSHRVTERDLLKAVKAN